MKKIYSACALLFLVQLTVNLHGASKTTEADLRAQLAQVQATNAILLKDKADAKAALAATQAVRSTAAKVADKVIAAGDAHANRVIAAGNAHAAEVQQAVIEAQMAAANVVLAQTVAKTQTDALLKVTEQNKFALYATGITGLFGFLTVVVGFWSTWVRDKRNHQWLVEATEDAARKMEKIDKTATSAYKEANGFNQKLINLTKGQNPE